MYRPQVPAGHAEGVGDGSKRARHGPIDDENFEVRTLPENSDEWFLEIIHPRTASVEKVGNMEASGPPSERGIAIEDVAEKTEFGGIVKEETADEKLGAESTPGSAGRDDRLHKGTQ